MTSNIDNHLAAATALCTDKGSPLGVGRDATPEARVSMDGAPLHAAASPETVPTAALTSPHDILARMDEINEWLVRADPALERVIAQSALDWDQFVKGPFEALAGAVLGQRVRYVKARAMRAAFYERLGGVIFTPDALANLVADRSACTAIGLDDIQVRLFRDLCAYATARVTPMATAADLRAAADSVKGIGRWTTDAAVVTALLDSDAFPVGDRWLARKMGLLYGLPLAPDMAQVEALSRRWSPYRAVAAAYLWRWFDGAEKSQIAAADA